MRFIKKGVTKNTSITNRIVIMCAKDQRVSRIVIIFARSHAIVIVVHNNASGLLTGAFMPLDKKKEFIKNTSITNRIVILCAQDQRARRIVIVAHAQYLNCVPHIRTTQTYNGQTRHVQI